MNFYHEMISKATGCNEVSDLVEIEDYMRNTIFESTLSSKTNRQLNAAAKTAWKDIQFMRSPEGVAYLAKLEAQMLAY